MPLPQQIKDEKDLEPYERLFANVAYWKKIGEEYQNPLIVTGTVLFIPHSITGPVVQREQEMIDQYGRHRVVPVRTYMERKGFILRPSSSSSTAARAPRCIPNRTARRFSTTRSRTRRRLSSYFELMDRIVPDFLSALSSQKIKGTRVLLK